MESLVETTQPVTMDVSGYSNIGNKLNFLAQAIKDVRDAENQLLYIECYTKSEKIDEEMKEVRYIRFSTDVTLWTEIQPARPYKSPILEKSIAVNLYDFFNLIDNCQSDDSEMLMFKIDEKDPENPELCIGAFYNELREYDELEIRLKIHKIDFPKREFMSVERTPITVFELDQMSLMHILNLNVEHRVEGVNIIIKDRKISFQTNYHGLRTNIIIKEYQDQLFMKDIIVFIPFYLLNLMAGTGSVKPIKYYVYEDSIVVESAGYNFGYKIEKTVDSFELSDEGYEEFCITDPKNAEAVLKLGNNLNKPAPISTVVIKRIEEQLLDVQFEYKGRYKISTLLECLARTDDEVVIDADILQHMVSNTNVDGVKIQYLPGKNEIYIKYENELAIREQHYNHEEFSSYRNSRLSRSE